MGIFQFFKKEKKVIKYILTLFLISRFLLTITGVYSRNFFQKFNENSVDWRYTGKSWLDIWGVWDSGYYLDIAKRGYALDQNYEFTVITPQNSFGNNQYNYAFFPLYPIAIKLFSYLFKDFFISGVLVSNLSLLIMSFVLYKLTKLLFNDKIALSSVKFLFLYPTSFIYSAVYAESMLTLLIILACYLSEKKKILPSVIVASLAALTKLSGILVTMPLMINHLKSYFKTYKDFRSKVNNQAVITKFLLILLPLGTIILLIFYQSLDSGIPFIFFKTESLGWGTKLTNPIQTIKSILTSTLDPNSYFILKKIALMFIVAEITMLFVSYKKIASSYWLFWFMAFIITLLSGNAAANLPRYSLMFFPQFFALAMLIQKKPIFNSLLTTFLPLIQILLMALWVNGAASL